MSFHHKTIRNPRKRIPRIRLLQRKNRIPGKLE